MCPIKASPSSGFPQGFPPAVPVENTYGKPLGFFWGRQTASRFSSPGGKASGSVGLAFAPSFPPDFREILFDFWQDTQNRPLDRPAAGGDCLCNAPKNGQTAPLGTSLSLVLRGRTPLFQLRQSLQKIVHFAELANTFFSLPPNRNPSYLVNRGCLPKIIPPPRA